MDFGSYPEGIGEGRFVRNSMGIMFSYKDPNGWGPQTAWFGVPEDGDAIAGVQGVLYSKHRVVWSTVR